MEKSSGATPKDVAAFMLQQLEEKRELYQEEVVYGIEQRFGKEFVYLNENGNPAIHKKVLAEFRKLTPNAVWTRVCDRVASPENAFTLRQPFSAALGNSQCVRNSDGGNG